MAAQTVIMSSSSSLLSGRSAASKPFTGTPIKQTRVLAVPRCRQQVVSAAAKEEQRGPSKAALGLFGAFAAAQLALLPAGPAEAFDLFPKTAISQEARDKLNRKTDNLPSITKTGEELVGGGDPIGAKNPQDVGKAIDKNTPDADLTKNPKSLGKDVTKAFKNALPDVSAVPTKDEIIKKFRSNKGAAVGASKKAGGGGNPLGGVTKKAGNPLSGGTGNKLASKANKTASKASSKVPSAKDIQKSLKKPLGALPDPKELANKAKANAPNPDTLASKAKAQVPQPLKDAKSKVKNSPAATIGLPAFELADLQGQNNQSENYPSPGKGYSAPKPNEGLSNSTGKITSPLDPSMDPPKDAGKQAPGTEAGVSSAGEIGDAVKSAAPSAPSVPSPGGNPLDAVKGLFGQ